MDERLTAYVDSRYESEELDRPDLDVTYLSIDELEGFALEDLAGVDILAAFYPAIREESLAAVDDLDLQLLVRPSAGYDNVDVEACTERGIVVTHAPQGRTESVVEATVAMMICCARHLHTHNARIRERGFEGRSEFAGKELGRSTVGIVGLGLIGGALAEYVRPFGADVIAHDPYVSEERADELDAQLVDLDELLETADFVSVHVPLTPETEGMLDAEHFRTMKETAFFVNAARGKLYSDADLARAVSEGWIAGAAVDVFEDEPDVLDNPLLQLDEGDILLTPHVLGMTDGATERTRGIVVDAIVSVADGEFPPNIVNPEAYDGSVPESRLSPGH